MSIGPGTVLKDNLVVSHQLGEGGMGSVWLAKHAALGNEFAVKVLGGRVNPTTKLRFEQEARLLARLEHPHIVRVFDFGVTPKGEPFIVMERLRGTDLASTLETTPRLDVRWTQYIVRQVTSALAYAHHQGVVHRDVKPANIFLSGAERAIKLVDFGAAKLVDSSANLTLTGAFLGTPRFMSPEQLMDSKAVDARSDLWALGAVVYVCLTGTTPFVGEGVAELGLAVLHNRIRAPRSVAPDLSPAIEAFLLRALHAEPAERFQSAKAFSDAFDAALQGTAPALPTPSAPRPAPTVDATMGMPPAARTSSNGGASGAALSASAAPAISPPRPAIAAPTGSGRGRTIAVAALGAATALGLVFVGWQVAVRSAKAPTASASTARPSATVEMSAVAVAAPPVATSTGPAVTPNAALPTAAPPAGDMSNDGGPLDLTSKPWQLKRPLEARLASTRRVESLVLLSDHATIVTDTAPGALTLVRHEYGDYFEVGRVFENSAEEVDVESTVARGRTLTADLMTKLTFAVSEIPWSAMAAAVVDSPKRVRWARSTIAFLQVSLLQLGGAPMVQVFVEGAGRSARVTYDAAGKFVGLIE